jgi:hypothetical protein
LSAARRQRQCRSSDPEIGAREVHAPGNLIAAGEEAEAAHQTVNLRHDINACKINVKPLYDGYSPPKAAQHGQRRNACVNLS